MLHYVVLMLTPVRRRPSGVAPKCYTILRGQALFFVCSLFPLACWLTHFAHLPAAVQMHNCCCVSIIMPQNSACIDSFMQLLVTSVVCVPVCHHNCVCETVSRQPCVYIMHAKFCSGVSSHNSSQHLFTVECSCRQGCSKSQPGPGTPFLPFFRLPSLWAVPSSACWQAQTVGQPARGRARRPCPLRPLGHAPRGSILCRAFSGAHQSHPSRGCWQQPYSCCYKPQINSTEGSDASYALKGSTTGQFLGTLVALGQVCLVVISSETTGWQ